MPADPLPWSERLRRRNGLPPTEPDDVAFLHSVGLDRSAQPLDVAVTITVDATAAQRGLRRIGARIAALAEPRCPHDLPTTMCHHCQETPDA